MMNSSGNRRSGKDWVTLIANFGVVVGLVLLAYELNQANKLAETSAYLDRLDQMQQTATMLSESDYLPGIYQKLGGKKQMFNAIGEIDLSLLTESERIRFHAWERSVMLRMSGHYYQYVQGYLDEDTGQNVLRDAKARLPRWQALGIEIEGRESRSAVE